MDDLVFFIPMTKVDLAQRLVFGVMAAEMPDRSGEIMDWETGKAAIQKWSDGISSTTGGESLGNIRLMHGKVAIGKLVKLDFDDEARKVNVCVKVVDDAAWNLVEERVLTGFSMGGGYAKRWPDPEKPALKRYTPLVSELSMVDSPCIPGAVFCDMLKADGTVERVELLGRFEPSNEDVKALAETLAKDAGKPDRRNDFVAQARADLIKAAAEQGAAKDKKADKSASEEESDEPTEAELKDKEGKKDPVEKAAGSSEDRLNAALAKAAAVTADPVPAVTEGPWADMRAAGQAMLALVTSGRANDPLAKGLWDVKWLADIMACFQDLQACIASEAEWEGDASPLPGKAKEILAAMGALLVGLATEEVAEVVERADGGVCEIEGDVIVLALATAITDLAKADTGLMEKVGARNSRADANRVQAIHDHAHDLGAACGDVEKLAKLDATEAELAKARETIDGAVPVIEKLTTGLELAMAKIAVLEKGPAPGKAVLFAVPKEKDLGTGAVDKTVPDPMEKDSGGAPLDPDARRTWARDLLVRAGTMQSARP